MSYLPCQDESANPEDWFAAHGSPEANAAKARCMLCPIYQACHAYALAEGIPYGIWGGADERERQREWDALGGQPDTFRRQIDRALGRAALDRDSAGHFTFTSDYLVLRKEIAS